MNFSLTGVRNLIKNTKKNSHKIKMLFGEEI